MIKLKSELEEEHFLHLEHLTNVTFTLSDTSVRLKSWTFFQTIFPNFLWFLKGKNLDLSTLVSQKKIFSFFFFFFQVWRLITNFLFFGNFGFNFLFNMIFTYLFTYDKFKLRWLYCTLKWMHLLNIFFKCYLHNSYMKS